MWILGVFVLGCIYQLMTSDNKGYSIHEQEKEREKEWLKKVRQEKENELNNHWR
jgi:hypothetical protein